MTIVEIVAIALLALNFIYASHLEKRCGRLRMEIRELKDDKKSSLVDVSWARGEIGHEIGRLKDSIEKLKGLHSELGFTENKLNDEE